MSDQTNGGNSKKGMLIGLIVILLLINLGFLYFWNTDRNLKNQAQTLLDQKETEFAQVSNELNSFKGKNVQLDSLINIANLELAVKSGQMDSLIDISKNFRITKKQLDKFKIENSKFRDISKRYLSQIDSLITVTKLLQEENTSLKSTITDEKNRSSKLIDDNVKLSNKVSEASILKAEAIVIEGIKTRGSGKEVESSRARNVDKLKICTKILENKITRPGQKDIYFRISGPDGTAIYNEQTGSGKFAINNKETTYTIKSTVNYQNKEENVCVSHSTGMDYSKGNYNVEIYADGQLIGKGTMSLK